MVVPVAEPFFNVWIVFSDHRPQRRRVRAPQQLSALQVEGPEPLWARGRGALRLLHGASGQQGGHGRRVQVRARLCDSCVYKLSNAATPLSVSL